MNMAERPALRERQKQLTRELIADAARRLFRERGFDAVTVTEVAREAGVSDKTVFNHFATKEDLFYSRMESFEDELLSAIRGRDEGESILDAFARFVMQPRGIFASPDPDAGEQLYAIAKLITDSPSLLAREQRIYEGYTEALAALIAEETNAGYEGVTAWVAANAIIGLHRALIEFVRGQVLAGERDTKRLARAMRAEAKRGAELLRVGLR
jgi:AcrR family transcriptional regulator